jgi:hypothetical protein
MDLAFFRSLPGTVSKLSQNWYEGSIDNSAFCLEQDSMLEIEILGEEVCAIGS